MTTIAMMYSLRFHEKIPPEQALTLSHGANSVIILTAHFMTFPIKKMSTKIGFTHFNKHNEFVE